MKRDDSLCNMPTRDMHNSVPFTELLTITGLYATESYSTLGE